MANETDTCSRWPIRGGGRGASLPTRGTRVAAMSCCRACIATRHALRGPAAGPAAAIHLLRAAALVRHGEAVRRWALRCGAATRARCRRGGRPRAPPTSTGRWRTTTSGCARYTARGGRAGRVRGVVRSAVAGKTVAAAIECARCLTLDILVCPDDETVEAAARRSRAMQACRARRRAEEAAAHAYTVRA